MSNTSSRLVASIGECCCRRCRRHRRLCGRKPATSSPRHRRGVTLLLRWLRQRLTLTPWRALQRKSSKQKQKTQLPRQRQFYLEIRRLRPNAWSKTARCVEVERLGIGNLGAFPRISTVSTRYSSRGRQFRLIPRCRQNSCVLGNVSKIRLAVASATHRGALPQHHNDNDNSHPLGCYLLHSFKSSMRPIGMLPHVGWPESQCTRKCAMCTK